MYRQIFEAFWDRSADNYKGLCKVIDSLKEQIEPDARDHDDIEDDDNSIQITISVNSTCTSWSYQSGDNSFTGSCYGDPFWGVHTIDLNSASDSIANSLIDDLADQIEFKELDRPKLINALLDNELGNFTVDPQTYRYILQHGIVGYNDKSNQDLLDTYVSFFDKPFEG